MSFSRRIQGRGEEDVANILTTFPGKSQSYLTVPRNPSAYYSAENVVGLGYFPSSEAQHQQPVTEPNERDNTCTGNYIEHHSPSSSSNERQPQRTPIKKHACKFSGCPKVFSSPKDKKRHEGSKQHEKSQAQSYQKRFCCPENACGSKQFRRKDHLKRHLIAQHRWDKSSASWQAGQETLVPPDPRDQLDLHYQWGAWSGHTDTSSAHGSTSYPSPN